MLEKKKDAPRIFLKNVTPLSLGILSPSKEGAVIRNVIKRNTAYPTEVTRYGKPHKPNQKSLRIPIFEGTNKVYSRVYSEACSEVYSYLESYSI